MWYLGVGLVLGIIFCVLVIVACGAIAAMDDDPELIGMGIVVGLVGGLLTWVLWLPALIIGALVGIGWLFGTLLDL